MNALETIARGSAAALALESLQGQIAALAGGARREVRAGHLDLGEDLWLSCDPGGQALLALEPGEDGLVLELEAGDSGRWNCLGMRIPADLLVQAQEVVLSLGLRSTSLIACSPVLRYFLPEGGFRDAGTGGPLLLAPGTRTVRPVIPVDRALAEQAAGCELNLFFLSDGFRADCLRLEPKLQG